MNNGVMRAVLVVVMGLGAMVGGCSTPGGGVAAEGAAEGTVIVGGVVDETARWVEGAGVVYAREHGHVHYAVVAGSATDLLVLEQEVVGSGSAVGGRVTWLIEVPGGARGTFVVGDGAEATGWMLEQAAGEKAHVALAFGDVVVEEGDANGMYATVRVSVDRRAARAGEILAPVHTLWGEYLFERMDVAMAE